MLEYGGAEIQILDLPGIIEGAAEGKGRGRQVISAAKVLLPSLNIRLFYRKKMFSNGYRPATLS